MSIHSLASRPVVLVRRARSSMSDSYGDDELEEVSREAFRAHLHLRTTDEPAPGAQNTNVTRWVLTAPPEPTIGRDDLVEVDGRLYELAGDPFPVWHPFSRSTHHQEVDLIQVVG